MREADEIERPRDHAHHVARARAGHLECEGDVLPHRLVREQLKVLKHDADVAPQFRHAAAPHRVDANTVDDDFAVRRHFFAVHQFKQRRFPGARVADQEDEAAFLDLEIDVVERSRSVGIRERNAAECDHAAVMALRGTVCEGIGRAGDDTCVNGAPWIST